MLTLNHRFILDVPYLEKDEAKALGARWDHELKKWYVPPGVDLDDFKRWFPSEEEDELDEAV